MKNKKFLIAVAICGVGYLSLGFGALNKYVLKLGMEKEEGAEEGVMEEASVEETETVVTEAPDTSELKATGEEEKETEVDTSSSYTKTTSISKTKGEAETETTSEEPTPSTDLGDILGGGVDDDDLLGGIGGN